MMKRVLAVLIVTSAITSAADSANAQWKYGVSSEFFVPLGNLNDISQLGISGIVYAGRMIQRRTWAFEVDGGVQWFIPRHLQAEEVPDWVANPDPDSDGRVSISGSLLPVRASITRFFGRYYLSPKVGAYFPAGDFKKKLELDVMFGIAPRFGYFYPMTRDVQFDLAVEYNYLFADESLQYVGFSFGLFFGGRRLPR